MPIRGTRVFSTVQCDHCSRSVEVEHFSNDRDSAILKELPPDWRVNHFVNPFSSGDVICCPVCKDLYIDYFDHAVYGTTPRWKDRQYDDRGVEIKEIKHDSRH